MKVFEDQLRYEGSIVQMTSLDHMISEELLIIRNHDNPLNEFKEDRYMISGKNVDITRGSIVNHNDDIYIIVTDIDRDNAVYNTSKILRCNYFFKHINSQGKMIIVPSVSSNKLDYSLGFMKGEPFGIPDDKMKISISNNMINKANIIEGTRIVFGEKVYIITHIDIVSRKEIRDLTLEISQTLPQDNITEGIAYNDFSEVDIIPDFENNLIIDGDNIIYYMNVNFEYIAKLYDSKGIELVEQPLIIYEIDKEELFTVSQTGNVLTIKPKKTQDKSTKNFTITATDGENINIKEVSIKSLV